MYVCMVGIMNVCMYMMDDVYGMIRFNRVVGVCTYVFVKNKWNNIIEIGMSYINQHL